MNIIMTRKGKQVLPDEKLGAIICQIDFDFLSEAKEMRLFLAYISVIRNSVPFFVLKWYTQHTLLQKYNKLLTPTSMSLPFFLHHDIPFSQTEVWANSQAWHLV